MGAPKGVAHAPSGSGSVGKTWDKKAGKFVWRGRVRRDGKTHYGTAVVQQAGMTDATCRRLARRNLDQKIDDLNANRVVAVQKQRARLTEYLDVWLKEQKDALPDYTPTYDTYEKDVRLHIRPFLGQERIANIGSELLLDWRAVLADVELQVRRRIARDAQGVRSSKTIKVVSHFLRRILTNASGVGYPVKPECLNLKQPKAPDVTPRPFLTEAQADLLCAAAPAPRNVTWRVCFYGGLRGGELIGLKWRQALWTKNAIDVSEQRDRKKNDRAPKAGSSGVVYLPEFAMAELRDHQRWMREHGFPTGLDDYVFQYRLAYGKDKGKPVPHYHQQLDRWIKDDAKAAELDPDIALHGLRHGLGMTTAAVATPLVIKDQLRHRLLTTTAVYTDHRDPEAQRRAANTIGSGVIAQKNAQKRRNVHSIDTESAAT
jgi:integrase